MDAWLANLLRQIILYSLPVLISLTLVSLLEARLTGRPLPHPFYPLSWRGSWLPLFAGLLFQRGLLIAPPRMLVPSLRATAARFAGHLLLCAAGFLLYSLSLGHRPPTGLPPLHHWWAKVLMFFNLCMAALHLLPLPGQMLGALLAYRGGMRITEQASVVLLTLLATSPLLDWLLGGLIVFPVYEMLSSLAHRLS